MPPGECALDHDVQTEAMHNAGSGNGEKCAGRQLGHRVFGRRCHDASGANTSNCVGAHQPDLQGVSSRACRMTLRGAGLVIDLQFPTFTFDKLVMLCVL